MRAGTADLHVQLEKRLPFFSESLDLGHYRRLMQAYLGFYRPLEQALHASAAAPAGFDLHGRLKSATLRADLLALGLSTQDLDHLPLCQQLPAIDSTAAFLGVMYVLEGATLGGQVLRREIAARLGLDARSGAAFLDIYGADTGRHWRSFLDCLGCYPLDHQGREAAATAARATFHSFERWLESREVLL